MNINIPMLNFYYFIATDDLVSLISIIMIIELWIVDKRKTKIKYYLNRK